MRGLAREGPPVWGRLGTNSDEWVQIQTERTQSFARARMGGRAHLDRYLEELEWRFNNRDNEHIFRDTLARIMTTECLP